MKRDPECATCPLPSELAAFQARCGRQLHGITFLESIFREAVFDIRRYAPTRADVLQAQWFREMGRMFEREVQHDAEPQETDDG